MKEIISIQIGGYANFVGSHFWNLQDEQLGLQNNDEGNSCFSSCVDFDVLYRVGETRQGVATYTPRLLAIDARGSLGAVKATGSLYEQTSSLDAASVTSWKGKVTKHESEPHFKNEFLQSLEQEELDWNTQQEGNVPGSSRDKLSTSHGGRDESKLLQHLEDTVQFWTDYSKVQFHPLSLFELEGIWHEATPFDNYGSGKGIFSGHNKEEAIDRLRFFVEEADHIQGLQILLDDSNGFAAVGHDLLEAVYDEYGISPVLLFTARPTFSFREPSSFYESIVRDLHDAISFGALSSSSSHAIPLGLSSFAGMSRYLQVNDRKNFHTSAVFAAAISCMTLPMRMDPSESGTIAFQKVYGRIDMGTLVHLLSRQQGRQVSISELAMPAPPVSGEAVESSKFQPLLEGVCRADDAAALEAVVVQGASSEDSSVLASLEDVLNCYGNKNKRFYHLSASVCPLALPLPFPNLFRWAKAGTSDVSSISIATRLSASVSILPYLEKRLHSLRQPGGGSLGWQVLEGWGLQKDDVRELSELMANVVAAYKNGRSESGSDSE